jgi:hypothetical protein
MKRNAEKMQVEVDNQEPGMRVETAQQGSGATSMGLSSACQAQSPRPEIAVLGWNVRSYRLSLRESKI